MGRDVYENYPLWIVFVSSVLSLLIYVAGGLIFLQFGFAWLVVYVLYALFLELRLLRKSCVNCYYYGKVCAFGKGGLSCLLFRRGSTEKFASRQISWKDILPDFLVSLAPMLAAVVLLVTDFSWLILALLLLLFLSGFIGTGFVRSQLACRHCRQRELGCPAEQLFNKKK